MLDCFEVQLWVSVGTCSNDVNIYKECRTHTKENLPDLLMHCMNLGIVLVVVILSSNTLILILASVSALILWYRLVPVIVTKF